MDALEDLRQSASIRGIAPDGLVAVVNVQWYGSDALELTYKDAAGHIANELLHRHDEPRLEVVEAGRPWSFDGDGALFRLVSEAQRSRLAHLFDPVLAVHTSLVEPLPHQITAVYEAMLPRQPLRFLLADVPGAGKTIISGCTSTALSQEATWSAAFSSVLAAWSRSGRTSCRGSSSSRSRLSPTTSLRPPAPATDFRKTISPNHGSTSWRAARTPRPSSARQTVAGTS